MLGQLLHDDRVKAGDAVVTVNVAAPSIGEEEIAAAELADLACAIRVACGAELAITKKQMAIDAPLRKSLTMQISPDLPSIGRPQMKKAGAHGIACGCQLKTGRRVYGPTGTSPVSKSAVKAGCGGRNQKSLSGCRRRRR
jgi:hypothetical protein